MSPVKKVLLAIDEALRAHVCIMIYFIAEKIYALKSHAALVYSSTFFAVCERGGFGAQ